MKQKLMYKINITVVTNELASTYCIKQYPVLLVFFGVQHVVTADTKQRESIIKISDNK